MATYLLTWNPARWNWVDLHDDIQAIQTHGYFSDSWGSGATRRIVPGDRVFLIKLGKGPRRGLMASGWATSEIYPGEHWDEAARAKGKTAWHVDVDFDTILDPEVDIFPHAWLDHGIYTKMKWEPRASGTIIPADVAAKLEQDWARFLNRSVPLGIIPVAKNADITKTYHQVHRAEGGSGKLETNRKIKRAAISYVTKHYKSQGWNVQPVEADKRGFDLLCSKGSKVEHVEVKGIKGDTESFMITASEVKQVRIDQYFVLYVVRFATSKQPQLSQYTAKAFVKKFDLAPMVFRASRHS
ncbi:MAG TPA: DUF3883 domain-containing protein [Anaerolineae bacterium]|nr:DUF3883 domain-containing protein [Anaerolineae bacterium]